MKHRARVEREAKEDDEKAKLMKANKEDQVSTQQCDTVHHSDTACHVMGGA